MANKTHIPPAVTTKLMVAAYEFGYDRGWKDGREEDH